MDLDFDLVFWQVDVDAWDGEPRHNFSVAELLSGQSNSDINLHVRNLSLDASFTVDDTLFVLEMVGLEGSLETVDGQFDPIQFGVICDTDLVGSFCHSKVIAVDVTTVEVDIWDFGVFKDVHYVVPVDVFSLLYNTNVEGQLCSRVECRCQDQQLRENSNHFCIK